MPRYARKLTKQDLIEGGITKITPTGRIFRNNIDITDNLPLNTSGYKILYIYDRDENGQCIKQYYINKLGKRTYNYKQRTITLNRAILAWYNGEIPEGYVADHIDNNRDDYSITNLQILTPGENLAKEREYLSDKILACSMKKPKSFYENKLEQYLKEYEQAKLDHDSNKAHTLRSNISQTRARLRYWDLHKEEYEEYKASIEQAAALKAAWKADIARRKQLEKWKNYFKESDNTPMWHQICTVEKVWSTLAADKKEDIFKKLNNKWPEVAQQLEK